MYNAQLRKLSAPGIQKLLRLLALVTILILAYFAHSAFTMKQLSGFLFLGLGGLLLVSCAPQLESFALEFSGYQLNVSSGKRFKIAVGILIVGTVLLLDAARIFTLQLSHTITNINEDDPWNRFIPGLILWFIGSLLLSQNQHSMRLGRVSILLLLILSIAVFLRVYLLDTLPMGIWFDEANFGVEARMLLHNWDHRPIFVDEQTLFFLTPFALMLGLLGDTNIAAMRLVEGSFAIGGVVMAYIVGRQLRGHFFGLLMALVLATAHWSINFSRIANNGMEVIFFTLLSFCFVLRLVRYGQMRDAILAGLSIGIGFWFYRSFQVTVLAFALYILLSWKYRPWKKTVSLGLTLALNVLIVIFPLIILILTQPKVYFNRVNQISIFSSTAQDMTVGEALARSIPTHLEMFHITGDLNGRHNLSGEPMLDPITGILFGLGLVFALRSWRKWENLFFYSVLILELTGGIFTLTFEAPQSSRTLGVLSAVAYFTALGALALGQTVYTMVKQLPTTLAGAIKYAPSLAILSLTLPLTALNYDVYFQKQRFSYTSWSVYSTTETLVGRIAAAQDDNTLILASPLSVNISTQFLAPGRVEGLKLPDVLPVRIPPEKKVVMFLSPGERMLFEYAQRLYPNATFRIVSARDYDVEPPPDQPDLFYVVELRPEDIASVQGLATDGSGIFYATEYQDYHFVLSEGAKLTLNQRTYTEREFSIRLPVGNNLIRIEPPNAELSWVQNSKVEPVPSWMLYHSPVEFRGVRAAFYANGDWAGEPVTVETHPFIYQYIHIIPMNRPYSVIYTGQLYAPQNGNYTFYLDAIDYADLSIDHSKVTKTSRQSVSQSVTLTEGWHDIEVRRQDLTGGTYVYLEWVTPGNKAIVPVPMENLRPESP